jgi:branched-chain amino acid transport system ATP-binding protein
MWKEIVRFFEGSPAKLKVARLMVELGFGINAEGKIVCGIVEIPDSSMSQGAGVDRRVVRETAENIMRDTKMRRIFSGMRVLENLELGAFVPKARKVKDRSLKWVFEFFPRLEERQNQGAGTLSGGERQMLAIGRALMSKPKLLLLDEPSFGLAPILVQQMFEMIAEINRQGVTVLLVEQNVRAALELASRAYVIENGRIVGDGKGDDLLSFESIRSAYLA